MYHCTLRYTSRRMWINTCDVTAVSYYSAVLRWLIQLFTLCAWRTLYQPHSPSNDSCWQQQFVAGRLNGRTMNQTRIVFLLRLTGIPILLLARVEHIWCVDDCVIALVFCQSIASGEILLSSRTNTLCKACHIFQTQVTVGWL